MLSFYELRTIAEKMAKKYDLDDTICEIFDDDSFYMLDNSLFSEIASLAINSELDPYYIFDMYETLAEFGVQVELSARNVAILDLLHEIGHIYQYKFLNSDFNKQSWLKDAIIGKLEIMGYNYNSIRLAYIQSDIEVFANNFMIDHMNEWL